MESSDRAIYAPLGIYIHIPFCVRKCLYCDFISYAGRSRDEQTAYVDALCEEIRRKGRLYKNRFYVDSIFFGGGTPTVLEAGDLIRILDCIKENFILGSIDVRNCSAALKSCSDIEISFEANPGTVSAEKLKMLKNSGFNRISIGVQSFDDGVLERLGRIHSSKEGAEAVALAKSLGFNTNIDLMFGVPGQTEEIWEDSLKKALELDPDHVSFYSLQLEEGTPLYDEYRFKDLVLPSWEENREMYHFACDFLKENGYIHYEISNAAKPGFYCRHNMKYWSMQDYLGIGEAAHSYIDGVRTGVSCPDPKGDYIFTRLRLIDGFPKDEYQSLFGTDFFEEFDGIVSEDLLIEENGNIKLTKKGLDNTNPVMEKLLNAIVR